MRLKDPQIDAALQEGHSNPDPQARKRAYAEVWKRFAAVYPYAYLGPPARLGHLVQGAGCTASVTPSCPTGPSRSSTAGRCRASIPLFVDLGSAKDHQRC